MKHKLAICPNVAAKFSSIFFFFLWPFLFISFYLLWATTEGATFLRVPITHHSPLAFLRAHLSCILVVPLLTRMQ